MAIIRRKKEVAQMLEEAQKRAKERIINIEQLQNILQTAEERILFCSTKKDAEGTNVLCDYHFQRYPHAYKFTPQSTKFIAEYTASGWLITKIWRGETGNGRSTYIQILWSDTAIAGMPQKLGNMKDWRG